MAQALVRHLTRRRTEIDGTVLPLFAGVVRADAAASRAAGGRWRDVGVPEISERAEVRAARRDDGIATSHQVLNR